jgi:hypothetical protein
MGLRQRLAPALDRVSRLTVELSEIPNLQQMKDIFRGRRTPGSEHRFAATKQSGLAFCRLAIVRGGGKG